jgi:hypothetical protein
MTPKQRVLKRHPKAHAYAYAGPGWVIYSGEQPINRALNVSDNTAQQAWASALKHPTCLKTEGRDA